MYVAYKRKGVVHYALLDDSDFTIIIDHLTGFDSLKEMITDSDILCAVGLWAKHIECSNKPLEGFEVPLRIFTKQNNLDYETASHLEIILAIRKVVEKLWLQQN